jgi:hypothetical protein
MVKMSHYFRDWGQPTLTIDWVSIWGQDKLGENPKHSETDGTLWAVMLDALPRPGLLGHTLQVIASSLVNFIMLGVVFARFSAPFKRASTVRCVGVGIPAAL